jgi:DNA-binding MarR family transcriptional regulator
MNQQVKVLDHRDDLPIFLHSELDEYGLDPFEFRVYAHFCRRGSRTNIRASIGTIAKLCKMSERKAKYCIDALCAFGLIRMVRARNGEPTVYELNSKSAWIDPKYVDEARQEALEPDPEKRPKHKDTSAPHADPPLHTVQTTSAPHADPPLHTVQTTSAPHADEVTTRSYSLEVTNRNNNLLAVAEYSVSDAASESKTAAKEKIFEETLSAWLNGPAKRIKATISTKLNELFSENPQRKTAWLALSEAEIASAISSAQADKSSVSFLTKIIRCLDRAAKLDSSQTKDIPGAPPKSLAGDEALQAWQHWLKQVAKTPQQIFTSPRWKQIKDDEIPRNLRDFAAEECRKFYQSRIIQEAAWPQPKNQP